MPRCDIWYSAEVRRLRQWAIHRLRSSSHINLLETFPWMLLGHTQFSFSYNCQHSWKHLKLIISHNTNHHNKPELCLTLLLDCVLNNDRICFNPYYWVQCLALYLFNHWHSTSVLFFFPTSIFWLELGLLQPQNYFEYLKNSKDQGFYFDVFILILTYANYVGVINIAIFKTIPKVVFPNRVWGTQMPSAFLFVCLFCPKMDKYEYLYYNKKTETKDHNLCRVLHKLVFLWFSDTQLLLWKHKLLKLNSWQLDKFFFIKQGTGILPLPEFYCHYHLYEPHKQSFYSLFR